MIPKTVLGRKIYLSVLTAPIRSYNFLRFAHPSLISSYFLSLPISVACTLTGPVTIWSFLRVVHPWLVPSLFFYLSFLPNILSFTFASVKSYLNFVRAFWRQFNISVGSGEVTTDTHALRRRNACGIFQKFQFVVIIVSKEPVGRVSENLRRRLRASPSTGKHSQRAR